MILIDTSAWVEYDRATESAVDRRVIELIAADGPIATTEPVGMEIFAGARDAAHEGKLRSLLRRMILLSLDSAVDFEGAARVYTLCRSRGVTPRSLIDCMIASVAMRNRAAVLAYDIDFARIASVVALDLDPATRTTD